MGQRDGAGTQNGQIGQYPRELQGVQGFNPMLGGNGTTGNSSSGFARFSQGFENIRATARKLWYVKGILSDPPPPPRPPPPVDSGVWSRVRDRATGADY